MCTLPTFQNANKDACKGNGGLHLGKPSQTWISPNQVHLILFCSNTFMSFVKKWDSYKIFCLRMKISWKPGSQVLCHYPNLVLDSIQCLKTSLEAQLVLLTDCVGLGCISAKVSTLHSLLGALGFIHLAVNF